MENGDSGSTLDVSMTSPGPPGQGNTLYFSASPNIDLFISRKTRIINSPNVNSGIGENALSQGTSVQQLVSTPVASGCSAAKRSRRDDLRVNPFEKHLLDQLHKSVWSPSILAQTVSDTPPQQRDWSVDQISLLNPSRIEESPSTHQNEEVLTPQTEARAQHAITRFFSEHIVPSPSPSPLLISPISNKMDEDRGGSTTPEANGARCSKAINTDLSFPSMLPPDVEQMLLSLSTPVAEGDSSMLNTSLRRRKLEFTMSPTGAEENDMEVNLTHSPTAGEIHHSPGNHGEGATSPRQFREGLESPNFTPIRGSNGRGINES